MDIDALLESLFARTTHGIKPGLDRTLALLAALDNPHQHLPVVHVAGTNGKGSTCSMIAAVLQTAGYRVGLYTSPHLVRFNERMRIDGVPITNETIARLASMILHHADPIEATFFEITTAMAFQWFAERRVDVAVIETGLGGRWDSTNVVTPLVSVITSIDMDHMEFLGTTLESIAGEKAGIIKPGVPAVIGEPRAALRNVFLERAAEVGAPLHFIDDILQVELDSVHPDLSMTVSVMTETGLSYLTVDVCGQHQVRNIACAIAALTVLRDTYDVSSDHCTRGLLHATQLCGLRGRMERLQAEPLVVLDVAHNPASLAATVKTLGEAGLNLSPWQVVFGAFKDKDVASMLRVLRPIVARLYACAANSPRAMAPVDIAWHAQDVDIPTVQAGTVSEAIAMAQAAGGPVLICGSFSVAEEALSVFR